MDDEFMKTLEEEFSKRQNELNHRPIADFDNLSPQDMFNLIHNPFENECILQYKKVIPGSVLEQIPFLNLVEYFLNRIEQNGFIKLTSRGNLPTKFVKELYSLRLIKEETIESGISKLSKESDSISISNLKIISMLSGLTKKKHGKLSLTKQGQKLIKPVNRIGLLKEIFNSYGFKFNLGYHDGYTESNGTQTCLSYTIFQLLRNGEQEKNISYYSQKMIKAYPHLLFDFNDSTYSTPAKQFQSCYRTRLIERFLKWFNLVEVRYETERESIFDELYLKANLISEVFEIKNENFKFKKGKYYA